MVASDLTERARVLRLRNLLGLTQRELADEFGVAAAAVAHWESGKRRLPGPALKLLGYYESELGLTSTASDRVSLVPIGDSARRKGTLEALALWSVYRYLAANADPSSIAGRIQHKALERYAVTASRLKGLSMKLLQMASFMDMVVDERERRALAAARASVEPMPDATVNAVFVKAFGKTPDQLFASWNARPFDVTSLGQVHDAKLGDGRRVVVKVQYPMMARALKADLTNVDYLDRLYAVAARGQTPGVVFAEIRDRILEECDYTLEAHHQTVFGQMFEGRADIFIPRVVPKLSARTVLTTERAEGMSFDDFVARGTTTARNRAGAAIWTFLREALYQHGIFNADLHPGNFVFAPDGRVSFFDFGRVKRVSGAYLEHQRRMNRAILERDKEAAGRVLDSTGVARPGFDYEAGFRFFACVFRPLLSEGPFPFRPEFVRRIWRAWTNRNPNRFRFDLGRDHVFLELLVFGGYALMARLGAEVDCRSLALDWLYEPHEPRPRPYTPSEIAEVERMADDP